MQNLQEEIRRSKDEHEKSGDSLSYNHLEFIENCRLAFISHSIFAVDPSVSHRMKLLARYLFGDRASSFEEASSWEGRSGFVNDVLSEVRGAREESVGLLNEGVREYLKQNGG